ncbi:GHKL domain-containing protein [bacterium]|nr:GHKL domain-containing protein [bacterium]
MKILAQMPEDPLQYVEALEDAEMELERMDRNTMRISEIISEMMEYYQMNQTIQQETIDLNHVIQTDASILKADMDIKHSIQLDMDLHEDPLPINARANEISQIFMNLVTNARDALMQADKKEITVRSGVTGLNGNDTAWFEVEDCGPGIPDHIVERFGEPFVSSKQNDAEARKRGSGTGLGIYMVKQILNKLNGDLRLETKPGRTLFRISFPLDTDADMQDVA